MEKKELIKKGIKNTRLKKKLGEKCVFCDCNNKLLLTIDHIKPLIRGGEDTDENKQVLCVLCNWLKGGLTNTEYKKYYQAINILKDLNKTKFEIGEFKINFSQFGHPKSLKDIEENEK